MVTTHYARGTCCYRAPELLKELPGFSNKVDIFALGCILFELVTGGKKAFRNDYFIHEYKSRDQLKISFAPAINESWKQEFESEIYSMLAADRTDRPSAAYLCQRFSRNRSIAVGDAYLKRKDYRNSIAAYTLALKQGSSNPAIWKPLGDCYQAVGRYDKAVWAYGSAIEAGLNTLPLLTALGRAQYSNHEYGKAISTFQLAIKKDPGNVTLFMHLADSYTADEQYKKAMSWLRKALRKSGDNVMLLEKLANVYYLSGDIEKAQKIEPLQPNLTFPISHDSGPQFSVKYDQSPDQSDFAKPFGWVSRHSPGSLTVNTSDALIKPCENGNERPHIPLDEVIGVELDESMNDALMTSTMTRKPRVKTIRSRESDISSFEVLDVMCSSFSTPSTNRTSVGCCTVSIRAKRQQVAQVTEITDQYSRRTISANTLVGAIEGYFPKHFDQTIVQYGDLVLVKEIYEDGWAVGIKLKRKVWEEVNTRIEEQRDDLTTNSVDIERAQEGDVHSGSDMYLVELVHFCHSDAWEEVIYRSKCY